MFIGQVMKKPGEEDKEPEKEKAPQSDRSNTSEEFLATPEAKEFVNNMYDKLKNSKFPATKRGISDIMGTLHRNSGLSNKQVMKETERILLGLSGLDGFSSMLSGLKAKSEGLIKGLKAAMGGG